MAALAIVIVSWNTRELLDRCLRSVHTSLANSGIGYQVVVVDNASSDGTPAMLRAEHPEVELIESGGNLGFAGGNNLALRRILGDRDWGIGIDSQSPTPKPQSPNPDYIMLLNPDTEVIGDALVQLVRYLEEHPDVAVVGPKLLYPDGSAQPSRRRFPERATFFWESTPLETRWPNNPWARRYRYADAPDDREQEVGWLVGAALLVRRAAIERAGLLDAGFAMYSEELEWQRRIGRLGIRDWGLGIGGVAITSPKSHTLTPIPYRVIYFPSAVIIHHEGKSSEQAPARRYLQFQRSRLRDARMTYGAGFAAAL
ncbi:MAG TPA: glycosyltransferase family 2 protein, partial [Roseiflexaceae bacterium]|nr:glycosyltransferase family 2 protein [Roseiflexaceae bacterium]